MAVTINGTTGIVTPDIGVDGTTLTIDSVNNRVGIVTDNPSSTLQVGLNPNNGSGAGVAAGSNGALKMARTNDADQLIEGYKVGDSSPNFVVRADGSTGIGTNSPGQLLHLSSDSPRILLTETTNNSNCYLDYATPGVLELSVDDNNVDANSKFQVRIDGATASLTLDSDGKLGLGESSPEFKFHSKETGGSTIAGLFETNQTDSYISFQSSGTTAGSTVRIGAVADNLVAFINGGERLRIDNVGSAQFTGGSSPSGRNTRISQYGSLLVATTGELISNARCAIDSGNGDIKTIGNIESSINTSTYQTGINLHTSSNLSTLTVYSNGSSTHRSFVVYNNGESVNANKYRAAIYANGNILGRRLFLGGSTNGGFDYNAIADTLEFLTTNGGTHSELNSTAYVPSTNGGKHLGHHNKRWDNVFCNGVRFDGNNTVATTLDDYEEGAYVPRLFAGTGTTEPSYAWRYGQYVKIGEVVTVWGALGINGNLPSATQTYIGGLPFNQAFDNGNFFHYTQLHGYTWASGYSDSGSDTKLFLQTANSNNDKLLITQGANKNHVTHAMIGSGQRFTFVFTYVAG